MEFNITENQLLNLDRITIMSLLELCDAQLSHTGVYTCLAENSLSADSQVFSNNATWQFNFSVLSEYLVEGPSDI